MNRLRGVPFPRTAKENSSRCSSSSARGPSEASTRSRASSSTTRVRVAATDFVTRKIARGAARIAQGHQDSLSLGDLDVRRDWGFAGDYVRAMWLMLFQDEPEDLVIGTGVAHSVAEFCDVAFRRVGLNWKDHVSVDPSLLRRADAPLRLANPARAKARLGWTPEVDFERLVAMMVDHEMADGRWRKADASPSPEA